MIFIIIRIQIYILDKSTPFFKKEKEAMSCIPQIPQK